MTENFTNATQELTPSNLLYYGYEIHCFSLNVTGTTTTTPIRVAIGILKNYTLPLLTVTPACDDAVYTYELTSLNSPAHDMSYITQATSIINGSTRTSISILATNAEYG